MPCDKGDQKHRKIHADALDCILHKTILEIQPHVAQFAGNRGVYLGKFARLIDKGLEVRNKLLRLVPVLPKVLINIVVRIFW